MPYPQRRGNGRPTGPIPKVLASSPRHSHFFAASIGCVPVGVRKSDGCCNLKADLATTASLSARRYAQSPELGEPFQTQPLFMPLPFDCPRGHGETCRTRSRRMRPKVPQLKEALEGNLQPNHEFVLKRLFMQSRFLQQQQRALSREIEHRLDDEMRQAIALWDTIPGVDEDIATTLAAEMGIRTEQFADGPHFASWTAMCPGNHESAGKRKSGKTLKGNRWLRGARTQAA